MTAIVSSLGYRPGEDVVLALDCASSEFYRDGVRFEGEVADGRCDLDKEPGYRRIAAFVIALLRGCGVDSGLCELDFGHS
jgi:enolase